MVKLSLIVAAVSMVMTSNGIEYHPGIDWNVGGTWSLLAGMIIGAILQKDASS